MGKTSCYVRRPFRVEDFEVVGAEEFEEVFTILIGVCVTGKGWNAGVKITDKEDLAAMLVFIVLLG